MRGAKQSSENQKDRKFKLRHYRQAWLIAAVDHGRVSVSAAANIAALPKEEKRVRGLVSRFWFAAA
jgi:hypothetical protein